MQRDGVPWPSHGGFWRKLLAFSGPGLLVAVGYMDPGNWATDLAGGARYGGLLLAVIFISNIMAMLLQHLSLKLGIWAERDLARACRDRYSRRTSFSLWILCEAAIVACDLAEVIGSAVALNLLFGWPLVLGVLVTAADVFLLLALPSRNPRWIEALVGLLILVTGGCFAYELFVSPVDWGAMARGLMPSPRILTEPGAFYVAVGILGATVMPHNLYLHSGLVQSRHFPRTPKGKREATRFATIDSTVSLGGAFFVNAAILVLAASVFHGTPHENVADLGDAHRLLSPLLGDAYASLVFGIALLAAGQNSTVTGTIAGQIVMEGFLDLKMKPWLRRLITRGLAIIPAAFVAIYYGEKSVGELLVFSQVVLSLQLSFAVFPLVKFTSDPELMGAGVNRPALRRAALACAWFIAALNIYLLVTSVRGWLV